MRRALLLLAALLAAAVVPASAQGDSISIRDFQADLVVNRDGSLDVTETIRFAFFGPWNGINRDLSLEHRTGDGVREKLRVRASPPTDEEGRELRYEEQSPDGWTTRLHTFVPDAHDAERTVVFRYRVENALRFFYADSASGPLDELYWNVTGNGWTMPIERVKVRVMLPDGVEARQSAAYTGYAGSTGSDAVITPGQGVVTAVSTRPLASGEGLTVAVGWEPGAISSRPTEAERQGAAAAARRAETLRLWPLGLPLLAFLLGFRAWRKRGRDPRELAMVVTYEPPDGLTPAEVGTLVDHTAEMRDVISTLVDLAVRGYVGIEEKEEKKLLGLFSSTDYVFHRRRPRETWGELRPHERSFLNALFSAANTMQVTWSAVKAAMVEAMRARDAGQDADPRELVERAVASQQGDSESVDLSDLQNKFYRSLPGIRDDIYDELVRKGYYDHRPDKVQAVWIGLGVLALIAGVMSFFFAVGAEWSWVNPFALALGVVVSGVLLMVFGAVMPARTVKGARTREAALGFREFLDKVESDRYRQMITSPELFERFLPYAMAFGVEGRWARAFEDLYREPPDWYSGSAYHGFRTTSFTSRMSTLSSRAGSTMSSSPSSSGSGGGGSSGGGSGGGGGSGF